MQQDNKNTASVTPLRDALNEGNLEKVKKIIEAGADVNAMGKYKQTPLCMVSWQANTELVKILLAHGADPNIKCANGDTALFGAQTPEIARLLIKAGADVNVKTIHGETPIVWARTKEIADILLQAGAETTPEIRLLLSCRFGRTEEVKALIAQGVNVNTPVGPFGSTPLAWAANAQIARLLIDAGADVNAKDRTNETPLTEACQAFQKTEVIKVLLEHGADTTIISDFMCYNALMWAVWANNIEAVKILIEHGADVNAENECGKTPLSIAKEKGYQEIITLLKAAGAVE